MALTPSISISQDNGVESSFTITDTSTGTDGTLTSRRIYLYKADNTTLVPEGTSTPYIEWPILDSEITLDVLSRDLALTVIVNWMTGTSITYTYTNYYVFLAYTRSFLFGLSTDQTTQIFPINILTSTNFFFNKAIMWSLVEDAEDAIALGQDTFKSQIALDRAFYMITNEDKFF